MQYEPIVVKTPVTISVDTTAVESTIKDKLASIVGEIVANYVDFRTKEVCEKDYDIGFCVNGHVIQDGGISHIPACGLEPPETDIHVDPIQIDAEQILRDLQTHIKERMSGENWKRFIAENLSVTVDIHTDDQSYDPAY